MSATDVLILVLLSGCLVVLFGCLFVLWRLWAWLCRWRNGG